MSPKMSNMLPITSTTFNIKDPQDMTPEERLNELSFILATGYLRYKLSQATSNQPSNREFPGNSEKQLDFLSKESAHAHSG